MTALDRNRNYCRNHVRLYTRRSLRNVPATKRYHGNHRKRSSGILCLKKLCCHPAGFVVVAGDVGNIAESWFVVLRNCDNSVFTEQLYIIIIIKSTDNGVCLPRFCPFQNPFYPISKFIGRWHPAYNPWFMFFEYAKTPFNKLYEKDSVKSVNSISRIMVSGKIKINERNSFNLV